MFISVAKAQQVSREPQARAGERKGTGSAAGRRSQMEGYLKSQGGKEKMDIAQGPNIYICLCIAEGRHKGKKVMEKSRWGASVGNCL